LPPAVAAAAAASIRHLKASSWEREAQQRQVERTKAALARAGLPVRPTQTHIVPVMVGDAEACKAASDRLLERHGIYIQPINYPTVPRGTERLGGPPGPPPPGGPGAPLTPPPPTRSSKPGGRSTGASPRCRWRRSDGRRAA